MEKGEFREQEHGDHVALCFEALRTTLEILEDYEWCKNSSQMKAAFLEQFKATIRLLSCYTGTMPCHKDCQVTPLWDELAVMHEKIVGIFSDESLLGFYIREIRPMCELITEDETTKETT